MVGIDPDPGDRRGRIPLGRVAAMSYLIENEDDSWVVYKDGRRVAQFESVHAAEQYTRGGKALPEGCTGVWVQPFSTSSETLLEHHGETCPIHEPDGYQPFPLDRKADGYMAGIGTLVGLERHVADVLTLLRVGQEVADTSGQHTLADPLLLRLAMLEARIAEARGYVLYAKAGRWPTDVPPVR
jgi:hypothetical protein